MEITKIFSDNQGNERLYTVLMSGDDLRLYGEFQKEFNSKAAKERNRKFFKSLSDRDTYDNSNIYNGKFKEVSDERAKKTANKFNNTFGKNHYSPEDAKVSLGRLNNKYLVNTEVYDPTFRKLAGDTPHNKKIIIENKQKRVLNEKLKNSRESIAKHTEKADKLRKLKYKRQTAGKIALGTAAAAGLVYGGKKLYDHYKKEE